jgi:hypothetical protein
MTSIGVDPKFGAGHLFLADARLALGVINHARYEVLQRTLGLSREQVNVVTFVAVLTAGDIAHDVAKRLPRPHVTSDGALLGLVGLSGAMHGVAGPASSKIPHFGALATFAIVGGLAAPGLRAFRRARATEQRLRTERIRRYVAAARAERAAPPSSS